MGIPPFVIILILVIAPMVLGALLKMFKAYQEEVDRQNQRKKPRQSVPTVPVSTGSSSSAATGRGTGEIDRFLQEIDKLRQKADSPGKAAPVKVVPVAKAVPKPTRVEQPAFEPSSVTPSRTGSLADIPIGRASAPALPPTPPRTSAVAGTAPRVSIRSAPQPTTSFGKNLAALLANQQSVAMAVVLQEVLGPPKCHRGRRGPADS